MGSAKYRLDVRKPIELVTALIAHWGAGGRLSLEGDLSQLDDSLKALGRGRPSLTLRRNTTSPVQDFLILPLNDRTIPLIERRVLPVVGLAHRVIHVQIQRAWRLVFGAYDNFHPECVWVSRTIGAEFLERLVAEGVLRSFGPNAHGG